MVLGKKKGGLLSLLKGGSLFGHFTPTSFWRILPLMGVINPMENDAKHPGISSKSLLTLICGDKDIFLNENANGAYVFHFASY